MKQVKNLNGKRVCDLSDDGTIAYIRRGNCETVIRIAKNGTLSVLHRAVA